jgi:hypothetical protein
MIVTQAQRERAQEELRRFYALHGVPQVRADLLGADADRVGWASLARCGQWRDDAPDPELFFAIEGDTAETYRAQAYCLDCPVRDLCDADATENRRPGVWGGVYREVSGYAALLCTTPLCFNYRRRSERHAYDLCRACQTRLDAARARQAEQVIEVRMTADADQVTGQIRTREVMPV